MTVWALILIISSGSAVVQINGFASEELCKKAAPAFQKENRETYCIQIANEPHTERK